MSRIESILIAGANGFLGRHAVEHYLGRGTRVHAVVHPREAAAFRQFLEGRKVDLTEIDLGDERGAGDLFTRQEKAGEPQAILNTAGAFEMFSTVEAKAEAVEGLFHANFRPNWVLLKHGLPGMVRRRFGRIALISAAATASPAGAGMGFYLASKCALNCIIQSTAAEMKGHDIKLFGILPTIIDTPRNRREMPDADFAKWVPASRILGTVDRLFSDPMVDTGTLHQVG